MRRQRTTRSRCLVAARSSSTLPTRRAGLATTRAIGSSTGTSRPTAVVAIIAIGERNNLIAYRIARARLGKRDEAS